MIESSNSFLFWKYFLHLSDKHMKRKHKYCYVLGQQHHWMPRFLRMFLIKSASWMLHLWWRHRLQGASTWSWWIQCFLECSVAETWKKKGEKGEYLDKHFWNERACLFLTLIIGRNGPKISSFIILESSGGSNRIVGSMILEKSQNEDQEIPQDKHWAKDHLVFMYALDAARNNI